MLFQRSLQPFGPLYKEKIFCVAVPSNDMATMQLNAGEVTLAQPKSVFSLVLGKVKPHKIARGGPESHVLGFRVDLN